MQGWALGYSPASSSLPDYRSLITDNLRPSTFDSQRPNGARPQTARQPTPLATLRASRSCYHLRMFHPLTEPGYYAGWGTLSLINAGLAQTKNRSGLLWFLISLFLGPIATFLIVVLDPATPAK
jgi:hypothetical protein